MAKGSVKEFQIAGLDFEKKYFTDSDIDKIIEKVNLPLDEIKKVTLHSKLEAQAMWYFALDKPNAERPTPAQLTSEFEGIRKATDQLLDKLFLGEPPAEFDYHGPDDLQSIPYALRTGYLEDLASEDAKRLGCLEGGNVRKKFGPELLGETVEGVYRLRGWAEASLKKINNQTVEGETSGHRGDTALNALINGLVRGVYEPVFGKPAGTSIPPSGGEPNGPLIRFIDAALDKMGVRDSDGNRYTGHAIRYRIRIRTDV